MRPGLVTQRRGLELADILAVVMTLTPPDFYKSMTTNADHTVWQDVYRPSTRAGDVYLKLTVIDDVLIVSFNLETAVGRGQACARAAQSEEG